MPTHKHCSRLICLPLANKPRWVSINSASSLGLISSPRSLFRFQIAANCPLSSRFAKTQTPVPSKYKTFARTGSLPPFADLPPAIRLRLNVYE